MAERMILRDNTTQERGIEANKWSNIDSGANWEKLAHDQELDQAFAWSQREMQSCGCSIKERIYLTEVDSYKERSDATAAFFYDRSTSMLLLRRNWKSGELRYDEIVNFGGLCLDNRDFIERLLENGITLSKLYMGSGVQK